LPNTAIIITTAPDTRSQGRNPPNQIKINNQLIKISKTHDLSYFDLNRAMGGWGSLNDWHKNNLVSNDKLHFNASGYALQGKMFSLAFLENYNDNFKNDTIEIFNLKNEILNNLKSILIPKKNNMEEITNPLNIKPTSIKSPKIYVVKRGDTIYRIAQKFHVSGKKILLINNLKENSIIRPGQKIKLP
jgi:LysM repeat protein